MQVEADPQALTGEIKELARYICSALGLYTVMGQDIYWLTAPAFRRAEIALGPTGTKP